MKKIIITASLFICSIYLAISQNSNHHLEFVGGIRVHSPPHPEISKSFGLTGSTNLGIRWKYKSFPIELEVRRQWWIILDYSLGNAVSNQYVLTDIVRRNYLGFTYSALQSRKLKIGLFHTWETDDVWTRMLSDQGLIVSPNPNLLFYIPTYKGICARVGYRFLDNCEMDIEYIHHYSELLPNSIAYLSLGISYHFSKRKKP